MGIKQVQCELVLRTTVLYVPDPHCEASSHRAQVVSHISSIISKSERVVGIQIHMLIRAQQEVN